MTSRLTQQRTRRTRSSFHFVYLYRFPLILDSFRRMGPYSMTEIKSNDFFERHQET